MNENFLKFYEQIATDQGGVKTALDVIQDDGLISVNDSIDPKYKGVLEIHNCINNPFYFLDKLKIKKEIEDVPSPMGINLSSFMAVKVIHSKKNNIIVDYPLGCSDMSDLLLGYVLHKLLFTDEYVVMNSSKFSSIWYSKQICNLYNNMPNYLKIKSLDCVKDHIIYDVYDIYSYNDIITGENNKNVGLIVYMDSESLPPSKLLLSEKIKVPIVVSSEGGDSRNFKYRFDKDHNAYAFKIINYDVKTLGISNESLKKSYETINNIDEFMKSIFMMYDDMTDEEAESLEKAWENLKKYK